MPDKYLKNTEANIQNFLIIVGDFNIRDNIWDLFFPFHSSHSNTLPEIANSLDLSLSSPIQQVPTQYSNNNKNTNLVINLFFLQSSSAKLNNHNIFPELHFSSDHTSLTIDIIIKKEFIQNKRYSIVKNSKKEVKFMSELIKGFKNINTSNILDKNSLECIVQEYTVLSELI